MRDIIHSDFLNLNDVFFSIWQVVIRELELFDFRFEFSLKFKVLIV